ncbi:UNVERIFIED_CONTAM: hypothetical protein KB580_09790 [Streptococcus canis]|uniref:hypothetical protein n=2 Tax=Streptococcus canis TaxID=1329 RepID=UPI000C1BBD98|nr:hypothetical protein [Streptococcus canis]MDV6023335.1 hypothetical protein [Streptococcus canis]GAY71080.1 uncharacterized protein TANIYAMA4_1570 [Streptococcus canis]
MSIVSGDYTHTSDFEFSNNLENLSNDDLKTEKSVELENNNNLNDDDHLANNDTSVELDEKEFIPVENLNLVNDSVFDNGKYISSKPSQISQRGKGIREYKFNESGNIGYKTYERTANDFVLFGVKMIPGRSYTAIADIKIEVNGNARAEGAFFDVKSLSSDGNQKTLAGGKGVSHMNDSIGK